MTVQIQPVSIFRMIPAFSLPENNAPITGEELFSMGDIGRTELVKGEFIFMSPTDYLHGFIEVNFSRHWGRSKGKAFLTTNNTNIHE